MKNWKVRERYGVQLRSELFNVFNHANFAAPKNDPTNANFGQITSVGPIAVRVTQGVLKLIFYSRSALSARRGFLETP